MYDNDFGGQDENFCSYMGSPAVPDLTVGGPGTVYARGEDSCELNQFREC
jgi:hypothetical protein